MHNDVHLMKGSNDPDNSHDGHWFTHSDIGHWDARWVVDEKKRNELGKIPVGYPERDWWPGDWEYRCHWCQDVISEGNPPSHFVELTPEGHAWPPAPYCNKETCLIMDQLSYRRT